MSGTNATSDEARDDARPRPGSGRDWVTASVVLVTLALVAVASGLGPRRVDADRCADIGDAMQRSWGARQRRAVRVAVADAGGDADRVTAELDEHARAWTRERVELCHAQIASGLKPAHAWGREQCLHRRAEELHATIGLLADVPPGFGADVDAWPSVLVAPDACRLPHRYRHAHPVPAGPNRHAQVLALGQDFARARVLLVAGRARQAQTVLEQLRGRADEVGDPALAVHLEAARLAAFGPRLAGAPDATEALRRLVDAAERIGDDVVAGRAMAMELVAMLGGGAADRNLHGWMVDRARAKAARSGDPLTADMLDCIVEHVGSDPAAVRDAPPCVRFAL